MKSWCEEKPGNGLALIFHNKGTSISGQEGDGKGYAGLTNVVVVELDLVPGEGDFLKPHVSVQFNDKTGIRANHEDTLSVGHVGENVADGKIHKMKIAYERNAWISKKGLQKTFQIRANLNKYFDKTYTNNWLNKFEVGLLSVYIDDMIHPVIQYCLVMFISEQNLREYREDGKFGGLRLGLPVIYAIPWQQQQGSWKRIYYADLYNYIQLLCSDTDSQLEILRIVKMSRSYFGPMFPMETNFTVHSTLHIHQEYRYRAIVLSSTYQILRAQTLHRE
eukprot:TRINITY_DN122695_c0_g1_i1.p4 TRINITY_DN122695_c0_g1~~TRINITY_DN122695_c0_g1_i1.p4  ORF type:complete len:277 (-),score=4.76 TRINITY_DN122695_c0_g1_i1:1571-2401(-)